MTAADHARELAACGITDHGEVSISFEIDASGKVVHGQVASTTGQPALAACLLRAVQQWQFPRPPAGAARGIYRRSFR
jgi:TonB family protein